MSAHMDVFGPEPFGAVRGLERHTLTRAQGLKHVPVNRARCTR